MDGHFRQRAPPLRRLVRKVGLACPPRVRCNGRKVGTSLFLSHVTTSGLLSVSSAACLALCEKLPDHSSDLPARSQLAVLLLTPYSLDLPARQHASVPCPDSYYPVPHSSDPTPTPPGGSVRCSATMYRHVTVGQSAKKRCVRPRSGRRNAKKRCVPSGFLFS